MINKFIPSENELKKIIYDYTINHKSTRMIGKEYNRDHSVISRVLKENGIKVLTRNESAAHTWKNHKHPYIGKTGNKSCSYGRIHSPEERAKQSASLKARYKATKKERIIDSQGYVLLFMPDHPRAIHDRIEEHRVVVEQHIGRPLSSEEHIHHINKIKTDNRIENLAIVTNSEHAKIHNSIGKYNERRRLLSTT